MIHPIVTPLRRLLLFTAVLVGLQQSIHAAAAVSAGGSHSLFLKADGTVWACGNNSSGQLGDGTIINRDIPVQVMSGVKAISAGGSHSLFLKTDGTVWACGNNSSGRLGDGTRIDRSTPVQVIDVGSVKAISAGGSHSLFLKTDGTAWACGNNNRGQNGGYWVGGYTYEIPSQVQTGIQAIAAGGDHSLFLKTNGELWYFGGQTYVSQNNPINPGGVLEQGGVLAFDAGSAKSLILKSDGSAYSLDHNFSLKSHKTTLAIGGIKAVSAGGLYNLFLKTDGTAWHGMHNDSTPDQVTIGDVQAISRGSEHNLFLKTNGTFWASGSNSSGQLGTGGSSTSVPTQVFNIHAATCTILRGQAWVLRGGQRIPVVLNDTFNEGDVVTTAPKSFIKLVFRDKSRMSIGPNSEGKIEKFSGKDAGVIDFVKGKIRAQVTKDYLPGQDKDKPKLIINTNNGSMGVRGTEFEVIYSEENGVATTRLEVFEGLVDMTDLATQQTVGVGAGESRSLQSTVPPLPVITLQPAEGALVEGQPLSMSAPVVGALTYQWSKDGVDIEGATATTYEISEAQLANSGAYTCTVTHVDNSFGPYISNPAWVTVYPETNLIIRTQPLTQTAFVGESAFFSSVATSAESIAYQWNKNGAPISGATAPTYAIAELKTTDAGIYTCSVSDADEQELSAAATLTVKVPPTIPLTAVAFWDFEDGVANLPFTSDGLPNGSGGSMDAVADIVMHGWNGYGGPSWTPEVAPNGGSLAMSNADGHQDGYVSGSALQGWSPHAWTIECSVYLEAISGWKTMIGRDGSSQGGTLSDFYLSNNGIDDKFRINIGTVGGQRWILDGNHVVQPNKWYALAVMSDGQTLSMWLDDGSGYQQIGSLDISSQSVADNALPGSDFTWTFGRGWYNGSYVDHIDGRMDNIRFSNGALAPDSLMPLEPPALSAADLWRLEHFGSAENGGNAADSADPDGDGVSNLLERAFGGDPLVSENDLAPVIDDSAPLLSIVYRMAEDAADLSYVVQETLDPSVIWTPAAGNSEVISDDGEVKRIRFTRAAGTDKALFLRLQVSGP